MLGVAVENNLLFRKSLMGKEISAIPRGWGLGFS
jgi:hypothetical protein